MSYDKTYAETPDVFGAKPEAMLVEYAHELKHDQPVLDVGVGQGRNALYLARRGFTVHGIDPSKVAVEAVRSIAARESLPITTYQCDVESFVAPAPSYAGVLVFGLVQILTWDGIHRLIDRLTRWTREGSLLFVTAFSVGDASYRRYASQGEPLGTNSFHSPAGEVRTFLEPGEILGLFADFTPIHHWEGWGPYHRHGDGPRERHAMVEAVLRR
jgi:tellurite methyltransferase